LISGPYADAPADAKSSGKTTDPASRTVTIGGDDWVPLIARFYLEAAHSALASAVTDVQLAAVALPTMYLQRHCLEVMTKDLILACFHVDETSRLGGSDRAQVKPPTWEHDLPTLVDDLRKSLETVGMEASPEVAVLTELANTFGALEAGSPERFRYDRVEKFKNGVAPPYAFPQQQSVDVGQLQARLEAAYADCGDPLSPKSLCARLYQLAGVKFADAVNSGRIRLDLPEG
jgi:hypothetical protein